MLTAGYDFTNGWRNDTWEFDGTTWQQRTTTTQLPIRYRHATVHDSTHDRLVLFGGLGIGHAPIGDTWVYGAVAPASWTPFGTGCPGTSGTPQLVPVGDSLPWLGTTLNLRVSPVPSTNLAAAWFGFSRVTWQGSSLPAALDTVGLPGCSLRAAPEFMSVLIATGGVANWQLPVPANNALIGLQAFLQAAVLDPGANAFGAALTNAGDLRVGSR